MADYANPNVLVSTDWVEQHKNDPNVKLVEVDVDTAAYDEGHIAGAVGWNWTSQLQDGVRRDILSKEQFEELMGKSGIKPEDTVILYGDNNNWFAAYALWQMQLYGHGDVRLMNGGRKKWLDENRPVTKDVPSPTPANYKVSQVNSQLRAMREDVLKHVNDRGSLVDVRSPAEFSGEIMAPPGLQETAQRAGRIPGAINVPWAQAVNEDGTFKSADDLKALYEGKGVDFNKDEVIAYCRIGERSSHTWFVLKHLLGKENVRNYDGSWTEWGSMVGMPIER